MFPSTTATAITTSYTGCTPLEHGLTGWFTYFSDAGCVAAALPFRSRGDNLPLQQRISPEKIYTAPSLFESLPVRSFVVHHEPTFDREEIRGAGKQQFDPAAEAAAFFERWYPEMPAVFVNAIAREVFTAYEDIDELRRQLAQSLGVSFSPDGAPVMRSGRSMPIRSEQDCSIESAWSGKSLVSCWYTDIARK